MIPQIVYLCWLVSEILLNRLLRSSSNDKQHADRNSLALIWFVIVLSNTIAYYVAMTTYFPILESEMIRYAGLAILVLGIVLRIYVVRQLGRYFTVDVTIREDHALKTDGPYQYLRHPSYFASLLSFVGFGLSLNNWISLLTVTISIIAVFAYRIKVEEKVLIDQFGDAYRNYKKTTRGLIPGIW